MLALCLSNFVPTFSFGLLMFASLAVAVAGDLILLPCLLYLRPQKKAAFQNLPPVDGSAASTSNLTGPHFDLSGKVAPRTSDQQTTS